MFTPIEHFKILCKAREYIRVVNFITLIFIIRFYSLNFSFKHVSISNVNYPLLSCLNGKMSNRRNINSVSYFTAYQSIFQCTNKLNDFPEEVHKSFVFINIKRKLYANGSHLYWVPSINISR